MDTREVVGGRPLGRWRREAAAGIVSREQPAPTSTTDPLYVQLAATGVLVTVTDWPQDHGAALPTQGAAVLVAWDDQGQPWVIRWKIPSSVEQTVTATGATILPSAPPGGLVILTLAGGDGQAIITVDPSTPAPVTNSASAVTVASNAFSPPEASVVFATWVSAQPLAAVADSLGALSWHRYASGNNGTNYVEIWYAACDGGQQSMTVTATPTAMIDTASVTHWGQVVLTGALAIQAGAYETASGSSTPLEISLTTTGANGSQMITAFAQSSDTEPTPTAYDTLIINGQTFWEGASCNGGTIMPWHQVYSGAGSTITTVTTTPSDNWYAAAAEVIGGTVATIALPPPSEIGQQFTLAVVQDTIGGRQVAWSSNVRWAGTVAPILSITPGRYDLIEFTSIDGGTWAGTVLGYGY